MSDNFDSIQSLLKQVHEDGGPAVPVTSPEEQARAEAEKFKAALARFKEDIEKDPVVSRRLRKFRREGVYAIQPWQWGVIVVGLPVFVGLLVYFVHLFSNVTRSNMAIRDGLALVYAGDAPAGIGRMNEAIRLGAAEPLVHLRFGTALGDMERFDSAVHYLDRAASASFEAGDIGMMGLAASRCAELFLAENKIDEAERRVLPVLTMDARQRDALITHGKILLRQSRYDEAEAAFIGSIERNPGSLMPRWYLRESYLKQGRALDAREQEDYMMLARPAGDEDFTTLTGYAEMLVTRGRLVEAEQVLLSVLASTRKPLPGIMVSLGYLALERQDFGTASAYADSAVLIAPGHPDGYVLRAEIRYHDGMGPEAITDLNKALSLDPHHPAALYSKGCMLLYDLGLYDLARSHFRAAERNGFDGTFLWYNIGVSEYYMRDAGAAIEAYNRLPAYMLSNSDVQWAHANALLLARQTDTALALFLELQKVREKNPALVNNLAVTHELRGDSSSAFQLYWTAARLARTPDQADTIALRNIDRLLQNRPVDDLWGSMHNEIVLRPRGIPTAGRRGGRRGP